MAALAAVHILRIRRVRPVAFCNRGIRKTSSRYVSHINKHYEFLTSRFFCHTSSFRTHTQTKRNGGGVGFVRMLWQDAQCIPATSSFLCHISLYINNACCLAKDKHKSAAEVGFNKSV